MIWWIGTRKGLAGRNHWTAFTRVPNGASVSAARSCARSVVETVRFTGIVVAAWPKMDEKLIENDGALVGPLWYFAASFM
ncbi:unnamed protein product [Pieris brassicae]|uniref:Uncharacterized protein n=1 Tax=Pieris brassicae TaxID=7116 RepID=A0A9P0TJE5_PIEBR|nr:unnamed protein product [Pieris brassicae]